ncbi:MAG: diacylglycerol kinase family lipid kinase [Deltaproteobacteria bacterium]|nr:diacylglycerol kinase family lipid kinase [Deltaproteobacteria bacterium]
MIEVIHNPVAGPKAAGRIEKVHAFLASKGADFRILRTEGAGDAVLMAREAASKGADAVVAVGGDGTIHEVANGLAGTGTRLAIVPGGTGNVFARELGLPDSVEGCLALLTEGRTITVPLGKANDRYFVLLGSAGFDAEVVERMNHRQKNRLGIAAYVLVGIRHFFRPQPPLWLDLPERERVEAQAVIVARGRKYGGNVIVAPDGNIEGNSFHVVALLRKGRWGIAMFTLNLLLGRHGRSRHVMIREAMSVTARSSIPSAAQVDGEYLGPLPVRFTMTAVPLRIVVPKDFPAFIPS